MPKGKSKTSPQWLKEHFTDIYVKKAQQEGYRSRAAYKLLELQERYHLFHSHSVVIDLGAAPGGWSQMLTKWIGKEGRIIALDVLPIKPIYGVEIIQGDFTETQISNQLLQRLGDRKVDWVISDMAPNMSGIESVDQARMLDLVESALEFSEPILQVKGGIIFKIFQGKGFENFLQRLRGSFQKVFIRKPKASRHRSQEIYLLAMGLKNK